MMLTSAKQTDFDAFLTKFGYSLADGEAAPLALSFAFLSTLPFKPEVTASDETYAAITEAQCFIAYSMTTTGGGFNPAALVDDKTLVKKGTGRSAIVKEWKANAQLEGTDPMSRLRANPMAFGLLEPYLSYMPVTAEEGGYHVSAGAFAV